MKRPAPLAFAVTIVMGLAAGLAVEALAKPVIGKTAVKLNYRDPVACMSGTSSVSETAGSEAQARTAVVAKWETTIYGSWQAAQNKTITCTAIPGGYKCTAVAVPCTTMRQ
jgi:hypothetical protein